MANPPTVSVAGRRVHGAGPTDSGSGAGGGGVITGPMASSRAMTSAARPSYLSWSEW